MLHSTLSPLLVSVASRYAQLSPSDVGIGINGGRLVIDNVQLRADTFNGPKIPFHVHEGRAGRLRVNVPWSALSSTPVNVYLENVHLIAGPKQHHHQSTHPPDHVPSPHAEWHQTIVGRLLFNVSVEIYGLKVEYRDDQCVGIISIASLRATSAGPDWNQRFVSLSPDLDPEQPDASAVSMRKLVHLNGVHWVMIPRTKGAPPAAEGLAVSEEGRSPRFSERHLDLNSYESKSPILDGIAITVRVLMCTGMALVGDSLSPGLHAEIEVDIEETSVSLTAQQIKWIDQILQKGFAVSKTDHVDQPKHHVKQKTKRRPRSVPASYETSKAMAPTQSGVLFSETGYVHVSDSEDASLQPVHFDSEKEGIDHEEFEHSPSQLGTSEKDARSEPSSNGMLQSGDASDKETTVVHSESEDETASEQPGDQRNNGEQAMGGFGYFWHALVGEYGDETVDDAAFALGLANGYIPTSEEEQQQVEQEEHDADVQYARAAVNAAAMAGGRTFKLRLKTPDVETRDEIDALRVELEKEKERRLDLEDVENVLYETESRIKDYEAEIETLRQRNASLVQELKELEVMTSQAGQNKDAMIRQMEAALIRAEKNLQAMHQARYLQQNTKMQEMGSDTQVEEPSEHIALPELTRASPESIDQIAEREDSMHANAEHEEDSPTVAPIKEVEAETSSTAEHTDDSGNAEATTALQTEAAPADPEKLVAIEVSDPEDIDGSNFEERGSIAAEPAGGAQIPGERQFMSGSFGINTKNIEQAMSSEGLTLV